MLNCVVDINKEVRQLNSQKMHIAQILAYIYCFAFKVVVADSLTR